MPANKKRICIVEDKKDLREGMELMLQLSLQTAREAEAAAAADALRQLARHHVLINSRGKRVLAGLRLEDGLPRRAKDLPQQDRLKLPAHLCDLVRLRERLVAREPLDGHRLGTRGFDWRGDFHINA